MITLRPLLLYPVQHAVAHDALIVQSVAVDGDPAAAVALDGVKLGSIHVQHRTDMVRVGSPVPIEKDVVAGDGRCAAFAPLTIAAIPIPEKLHAMDGQVFLDEDDDVYCVWRGDFDRDTNILSYGMDLFQRQGKTWLRSFEEHREYAYSQSQLTGFLKEAGFTRICVYGDRKFSAPGAGEQRIFFSARKGTIK